MPGFIRAGNQGKGLDLVLFCDGGSGDSHLFRISFWDDFIYFIFWWFIVLRYRERENSVACPWWDSSVLGLDLWPRTGVVMAKFLKAVRIPGWQYLRVAKQ